MIPLYQFETDAIDTAQEYAREECLCRQGDWRAHLAFFEEGLINELAERGAGTEACS